MQRLVRAASIAFLVLAAAAVGSPVIAADRTVSMRDNRYVPVTVTIRPGDTVTWTNDGQLPHDASGNGWSTALLNAGQSDAVRFTRAGTYRYQCTIHAEMRGTVVVQAAGGPTIPPTDTVTPGQPTQDAASADAGLLAIVVAGGGIAVWAARRRLAGTH